MELCRYGVLNPVRAGVVRQAESYPWSSYRATAGLGKMPPLLTVDWVLGQFADERMEARKQYRQFILAGIEETSPWEKLKATPIQSKSVCPFP